MGEVKVPNYEIFDNVNDTYPNFILKLMDVIDKVAPVKNKRIKINSQEWFDGEFQKSFSYETSSSKNTKNLGFT